MLGSCASALFLEARCSRSVSSIIKVGVMCSSETAQENDQVPEPLPTPGTAIVPSTAEHVPDATAEQASSPFFDDEASIEADVS
jgi:hypothetical protein